MRSVRPLLPLLYLFLALSITGCDHATKVVASAALSHGQVESLVSGVLSLERVHNTDTAFGLLSAVLPLSSRLMLLRTTATLGLLFVAGLAVVRFERARTLERIALTVTLGGAAGNALDRWRWGYVVDFIHVEYWPVFNVADIALCVGVVLLGLSQWRRSMALERVRIR